MSWLEEKYIGILGLRLRNFKRKGPRLWNFSCPLCGDSPTDSRKARGFVYDAKGELNYCCKKCGVSTTFRNFLKKYDSMLYTEMRMEIMGNRAEVKRQVEEAQWRPLFTKDEAIKGLLKVSSLPDHDPVRQLVLARHIPPKLHYKLYRCPNFCAHTNKLIPGKFSEWSVAHDETRLLIPFINKSGKVHAYQGRSLSDSSLARYLTIQLMDDVPLLYGLDTVNPNYYYHVLEGPIDAMFLPNAVATAGGDLVSAIQDLPKERAVICYDNERRSPQTIQKMRMAVQHGYSLCIWPRSFEHKDINDAILKGYTTEQLTDIIKQNTFKDLVAEAELSDWRLA